MRDILQELGCEVESASDGALWTWVADTRGRHCVRVLANDAEALVQVFAPLRVPVERRHLVRLLLTHLNAREHPCFFELDLGDGEVRCRTVARAGPRGISLRRMRDALFAAVRAMDRHLCRIEAVIAGIEPDEFTRA